MALVSDKSLFIHVPKCAGTFVRSAMCRAFSCTESGLFEVEDHFGIAETLAARPDLSNRFSFGFVRHPATWLRSRWSWAVQTDFPAKMSRQANAAAHWMADCWSDDFITFAEHALERYPGIATRTMFHMLGLWGQPVTFIGRAETVRSDLIHALTLAGERFDLEAILVAIPERVSSKNNVAIPGYLQRRILDSELLLAERFGYG